MSQRRVAGPGQLLADEVDFEVVELVPPREAMLLGAVNQSSAFSPLKSMYLTIRGVLT